MIESRPTPTPLPRPCVAAFTLIELLVVISIIGGVLAAIVSLLAIQAAVVSGIEDVANQVFSDRLAAFHNEAQPEIYAEVAMMIELTNHQ